MNQDSILKFKPNVHPALWGGESWEISVHPAGPSVIREGVLAGKPLSEAAPGFPLLVKVIDAKMRLSVQVHPNETTCKLTGGDPKTEMWAMLEDGVIYAGLKPGVGPKDVEEAVKSGRFEELLVRHDAKKGEAFFIPGGLVHAIGDGALIYEVQQSSDTTFRLYDWNRVGADGKPRELHVAKSLEAIDYSLPVPQPATDVKCSFFEFRQVALDGGLVIPASSRSTALFAAEGSFTVNGVEVPRRTSVLALPGEDLALRGSAHVFVTTP
jgi:mannose-6-phosphate isomerase